jgi:hypothetical protein
MAAGTGLWFMLPIVGPGVLVFLIGAALLPFGLVGKRER